MALDVSRYISTNSYSSAPGEVNAGMFLLLGMFVLPPPSRLRLGMAGLLGGIEVG